MRLKRHLKRLFLLAAVLGSGAVLLYLWLRPAVRERTEIFRGVFLTVQQIPRSGHGSGRIMIVEVHWDTPGVRIAGRDFSFPTSPGNDLGRHYRLANADWALAREQAGVLVNTAGYYPEKWSRSIPGFPVSCLETVVVDGQASHVHEHSYLLYWDRDWNVHLQRSKPPSTESLDAAILGIGVQGIPLFEGQIHWHALGNPELVMPRTFIGVDPLRRILWLIAYENASGYLMLETARDAGVIFGGMVDSGNASHLLVGPHAPGVFPHTGLRHWRPLGPYLTVHAEPLE